MTDQTSALLEPVQPRLLDIAAAGAYLGGVSESTLAAWRRAGTGPRWIRLGAHFVRYPREELDRYIEQELAVQSGAR